MSSDPVVRRPSRPEDVRRAVEVLIQTCEHALAEAPAERRQELEAELARLRSNFERLRPE